MWIFSSESPNESKPNKFPFFRMKNLPQNTNGQWTDLLCNIPVYVKEHIK